MSPEIQDSPPRLDHVGAHFVEALRIVEEGRAPLSIGIELAAILHRYLSREMRAMLSLAGTFSLSRSDAVDIVDLLAPHLYGAGAPIAPLDDAASEARNWVALASLEELRAYAWHAFMALPPRQQERFLQAGARHTQAERAFAC